MSDYLTLCEQAARAGARELLAWIGRFGVREKGPSDLVTEADNASQEAIRRVLLGATPDFGFVSEESAEALNSSAEFCWVVDPLDGTTNYVHQLPHYAVSIALLERGRPIVGVVLDPVHEECFSAERGHGATLNGRPIRVSGIEELGQAMMAASFAAQVQVPSREVDQFIACAIQCQAMRRTGSAALNMAYVAAGRLDAFWALSTKIWDVAAGALLVEEAGGVVSSLNGGAFDLGVPHPVASASVTLHKRFLELLHQAPAYHEKEAGGLTSK